MDCVQNRVVCHSFCLTGTSGVSVAALKSPQGTPGITVLTPLSCGGTSEELCPDRALGELLSPGESVPLPDETALCKTTQVSRRHFTRLYFK